MSADRSFASLQMRTQHIFEEEERSRTREPVSFELRQTSNNDSDGPIMPPVPESRDYSSIEDRQRERENISRLEFRRMLGGVVLRSITESDPASTSRRGPSSPRPSSLTPALSSLPSSPGSTSSSPIEGYGTISNPDPRSSSRATPRVSYPPFTVKTAGYV